MVNIPLTRRVLRFTKIEHTAFSLPLVFAGAWIGSGGDHLPGISTLFLILAAAIGARVFGMSFNRIFDRRLDSLNPRTAGRELPSGGLSVTSAFIIAFSGLAVYLASCLFLGGWCLLLSPVPLVPLLGYSLLKRFTALCHFGIGLSLAIAPIGAFVAVTDSLKFPAALWLFSGFVFLWLSGADIIYALLDLESDRKNKIHSLPAKFGRTFALGIAAMGHFLAFVLLSVVYFLLGGGFPGILALGLTAAALGLSYAPFLPVKIRFFPVSTIAGIAAALVPVMTGYN